MVKFLKILSFTVSLVYLTSDINYKTFSFDDLICDPITQEKNKLKEEEKKLEENLKVLKNDKNSKKKYTKELSKQIQNFQKQIDNNNKKIFQSEREIREKKEQIEKTKKDIVDSYAVLKERLKAFEKTGDLNMIDMVFDPCDNFSDFFDKIDIANKISSSTASLVEELKKQIKKIEEDKKQIENTKNIQEKEKVELEEKKEKLRKIEENNKAELEILQKKKEEIFKNQKDERSKFNSRMIERFKKGSACYNVSHAIKRNGTKYAWPTINRFVSCPFGPDGGRFHEGIDIPGAYGDPIFAAQDGIVIEVNSTDSYGKGWGYYVLIDHGQGNRTRYAHLSCVAVYTGQKVDAGEQIASMGRTGRATCNHLHFESSENGVCYNPMKDFN